MPIVLRCAPVFLLGLLPSLARAASPIALDARPARTWVDTMLTVEVTLPPQVPDGVQVYVAVSDGAGTPVCPGPLPRCLGITGSLTLAGAAPTVNGQIRVTWDVPTTWPTGEIEVQAVVLNGSKMYASDVARVAVLAELPPSRPDFDGDGRGDMIVAATNEAIGSEVGAGGVHILAGTGTEYHFESQQVADLGTGSEAGDHFGAAMAWGDFDGDGYDDLLIGWYGEDVFDLVDAGWAAVRFGGRLGVGSAVTFSGDSPQVPGVAEAFDTLGQAVAAGDFDGDGYDDVVIGVPGDHVAGLPGAGSVAVLFGDPTQLGTRSQSFDHTSLPAFLGGVDARLGSALAVGDFDGDGYDDLAIGAPDADHSASITGSGMVTVVFGSAGGLDATDNVTLESADLGVPAQDFARFGLALAAGDIDGDGQDELVIGEPDAQGLAGRAYLTGGGRGPWSGRYLDVTNFGVSSANGDAFGSTLAIEDMDRDGYDDVAIGAPLRDARGIADAGEVFVLYGTFDIMATDDGAPLWWISSSELGALEVVDGWFGASLRFTDYDGNGYPDLLIGGPGETAGNGTVGAGAVTGLPNGPLGLGDGPLVRYDQASPSISGVPEVGDAFGGAWPYDVTPH